MNSQGILVGVVFEMRIGGVGVDSGQNDIDDVSFPMGSRRLSGVRRGHGVCAMFVQYGCHGCVWDN